MFSGTYYILATEIKWLNSISFLNSSLLFVSKICLMMLIYVFVCAMFFLSHKFKDNIPLNT
ncbi:hypothetical protein HanOQP8_Chr08g0304401 [Helianthus annuus]|nr:hypothetical protein HanLR1_Chr08g0297351 [Helianthus annuus]KAJ0723956.1 hypothetical protein HanOQP8_Chr08g0304401 [Helianthus annuus]